MNNLEWVGWMATATFAGSYFLKSPNALRRVQAAAALMWLFYGAAIHSAPVIVANLVVAAMAGLSSLRIRMSRSRQPET